MWQPLLKELSVKLLALMDCLKLLHIGKRVDSKSSRKSSLLTESIFRYVYRTYCDSFWMF